MPKGPQAQKRPADVVSNAVRGMQIATGEAEEDYADEGKDKTAQELGGKAGIARAKSMSKRQRSEIASKAARVRWDKANPRHGFDYLVIDRRVQQSSLLIITGATVARSPLTRSPQDSRLRAFRRIRQV